jgi:glutamate synthase (NADPH) large chain
VVLGATGRNFAAGMSGGIAYVFDPDKLFAERCNPSMVTLEALLPESEQEAKVARHLWHLGQADEVVLRQLIEWHSRLTGSIRARVILDNWEEARANFIKVFPNEYRRALDELADKARRIAA